MVISEEHENVILQILNTFWKNTIIEKAGNGSLPDELKSYSAQELYDTEIGVILQDLASICEGTWDWSDETMRAALDDCLNITYTMFSAESLPKLWDTPLGKIIDGVLYWAYRCLIDIKHSDHREPFLRRLKSMYDDEYEFDFFVCNLKYLIHIQWKAYPNNLIGAQIISHR